MCTPSVSAAVGSPIARPALEHQGAGLRCGVVVEARGAMGRGWGVPAPTPPTLGHAAFPLGLPHPFFICSPCWHRRGGRRAGGSAGGPRIPSHPILPHSQESTRGGAEGGPFPNPAPSAAPRGQARPEPRRFPVRTAPARPSPARPGPPPAPVAAAAATAWLPAAAAPGRMGMATAARLAALPRRALLLLRGR